MKRHPAIPWVLPFAVFMALLTLNQVLPVRIPEWVRFFICMAAILAASSGGGWAANIGQRVRSSRASRREGIAGLAG